MRFEITLIIFGVIGVLFNSSQFLAIRKINQANKKSEEVEQFIEYNLSLFWMSLVCLSAGIYLITNDDSIWYNTLGVFIAAFGLSSFIQSFRPNDTARELEKFGRDPEFLKSTLRNSRIIGIVAVSVGIFLFIR